MIEALLVFASAFVLLVGFIFFVRRYLNKISMGDPRPLHKLSRRELKRRYG